VVARLVSGSLSAASAVWAIRAEVAQPYGVVVQAVLDAAVCAALGIGAVGAARRDWMTGQELDPLVDVLDGPDVEVAGGDRLSLPFS
jgi:hypothetical protein